MRRALIFLFVTTMIFAVVGPVAADPPASEPVTIAGPWGVGDPEGDAFLAELGANKALPAVAYEAYGGFDDLVDRVTGEDPPDLVVVPQIGVVRDLADYLVDLGEFVNPATLRRDFGDYLVDFASVDGVAYGAPIKLSPKTLVWYKPAEFEAAGYPVPTSFNELVALTDSMVADGRDPWTNYIESGFATGWMGTDWIEDLLLGAEGPAVYDQWVEHVIPFTDPRVEAAFERYQQMIDSAGYVWDRALMLNVPFSVNAETLLSGDAMMHKQASFFAGFIGSAGGDLGDFATFAFPSVDPAFNESMMGGGDYVSAVNDGKDVRQIIRFLTSHRFGREVIADTVGWVLPNVRFDTKRYADDLTRSWAEDAQAAVKAGQFRFDGSDLMPPEVGAGTFWAGIVDLVAYTKAIPEVLIDIEASWP